MPQMTYSITPHRVPFGVLDCWMWARESKVGTDIEGTIAALTVVATHS
jgi:hypothetical protein